ncbi:MAG: hypothetical protein JST55_12940 [Bacteroidetes bacterium]|nr:hypothetical protein [Bacteroidota bacterium]
MIKIKNLAVVYLPLLFLLILNSSVMSQTINTALMDKLIGKWEIKYDGAMMYETWEKVSDTLYKGKSQMIQKGEVVFEEIMELAKQDDGKFYFIALIKDRKIKLEVVKTEGDELLYESETDKNKVSYKFEGDKLHARIIKREDNTIKEEFLFTRSG